MSTLKFCCFAVSSAAASWVGCESFPGFGSASDNVTLTADGLFDITTQDFLQSRSCQGSPDLNWGHAGTYTCDAKGAGQVAFQRRSVWLQAHTFPGVAFGRVLCPHISLTRGIRVEVPLEDLPTKCASVTFNNCERFHDALSTSMDGSVLHRSKAPSCDATAVVKPDGPALTCTDAQCDRPCATLAVADSDTCGQQCAADADCSGCGSSGKCSMQGGGPITATCVDSPANVPSSPEVAAAAVDWPAVWTSDIESLTYNDYSDKSERLTGKFYYDFENRRQRQDWTSKGTSLLYIGAKDPRHKSKFYFIAPHNLACFYAVTKDPVTHLDISLPRPSFMRACAALYENKYEGRQRVLGEWVDHFSCSLAWNNESVPFSTWHSLGLGNVTAGLPLQLTAGTSKPNWQSPRLTTQWYSNHQLGREFVPEHVFSKPPLCIPIPSAQMAAALDAEDVVDRFRESALAPSLADLRRARLRVPHQRLRGSSMTEAMTRLNRALTAETRLSSRACHEFGVDALQNLQLQLFGLRSEQLQDVYVSDRRDLRFNSSTSLRAAHVAQREAAGVLPELLPMVRDGLCHETVMMFVHHVSAATRQLIASEGLVLPLLPERARHEAPESGSAVAAGAYQTYTDQVGCVACHVSSSDDGSGPAGATLV